MIDLCTSRRAVDVEHRYLEVAGAAGVAAAPRVILTAKLPLAEVVTDFFDTLKHRSSGYASFECVQPLPSLPHAVSPLLNCESSLQLRRCWV